MRERMSQILQAAHRNSTANERKGDEGIAPERWLDRGVSGLVSREEPIEIRMTVDAALGVRMQTSLHPSPKSSRAFLIAAVAECRLSDNAPA